MDAARIAGFPDGGREASRDDEPLDVPAHPTGLHVRDLRRGRGWIQADLARSAGIDVATVSRIETGQVVGGPKVDAVLGALGVTVGDLVGRSLTGGGGGMGAAHVGEALPTPHPVHLLLRDVLRERGWTQGRLSRHAGIDPALTSKVLSGRIAAGEVVEAVLRALGITWDQLATRSLPPGGPGAPPGPRPVLAHPLSRHVRDLRVCAGLSQAELGRAADVQASSVSRIETGKVTDGPDVAAVLAALGVTWQDLAGRDLVHPELFQERLMTRYPGLSPAVREGRLALGLTQAELGRAVGLPNNTVVSDVEGGMPVPNVHVRRLVDHLRISLDDLPAVDASGHRVGRLGAAHARRDLVRVMDALGSPEGGVPRLPGQCPATALRAWVGSTWRDGSGLDRSWHHALFAALARDDLGSERDLRTAVDAYWREVGAMLATGGARP